MNGCPRSGPRSARQKLCDFALKKCFIYRQHLFLSSAHFSVSAEETIPVPGDRFTNGWSLLCQGSACRSILDQLQTEAINQVEQAISEDPPPIDHARFCSELKKARPANCGMTIPATPAFPNGVFGASPWVPNGCGSAAWQQMLIDQVVGDHNEPVKGFRFESACNAHDTCWGNGVIKGACDKLFLDALLGVIGPGGVTCANHEQCGTTAAAY